ncbi:PREDICTED: acidic leucine-rich nuclear phosphoprotein 32 family member B-like [Atta cephalotes]|uniref:Uncharacterized protein n=1 Tax=Atta cephalotes TaxID=12957 RepID=A0A158NWQ9_ATTCE|nr:PREDICTED: acidic leucine-rich nuclear phosphoprotein 32 family member B-like [Atta cephalotes]
MISQLRRMVTSLALPTRFSQLCTVQNWSDIKICRMLETVAECRSNTFRHIGMDAMLFSTLLSSEQTWFLVAVILPFSKSINYDTYCVMAITSHRDWIKGMEKTEETKKQKKEENGDGEVEEEEIEEEIEEEEEVDGDGEEDDDDDDIPEGEEDLEEGEDEEDDDAEGEVEGEVEDDEDDA